MAKPASGAPASARLLSLDAYRGFTMLAMASGGLGLGAVARRNSNWAGFRRTTCDSEAQVGTAGPRCCGKGRLEARSKGSDRS